MNKEKTMEPTISIQIDAEEDGTFSTTMKVTGLESFSQANAASEHMQQLFCGGQVQFADGHRSPPPST
jgi:translation initiation factor 1 (eIF-1/SUI1)